MNQERLKELVDGIRESLRAVAKERSGRGVTCDLAPSEWPANQPLVAQALEEFTRNAAAVVYAIVEEDDLLADWLQSRHVDLNMSGEVLDRPFDKIVEAIRTGSWRKEGS